MINGQQIREIIRIINTFGNKSSKALFLPKKNSSQVLVLARKFASPGKDEERAWAMEVCNSDEHDLNYIRVRSELKHLLLGRLFHLHIRTGSELRKATYRNAKEVFCIRVLLMLGARRVAMRLIPSAMERARKFELTSDR